jgi:hypothetical protein
MTSLPSVGNAMKMRGMVLGLAIPTVFAALAACGSSSSAPAATIHSPAGAVPASSAGATSEANCTVDCVNPVASTNAEWYAQVSGALGQVQDDLTSIQADANSPDLTVDGAQLAQDAQAALDTETDPAPIDNADFVTAMNDYVAAGNDYSGFNDSGTQNAAQAAQEVAAAQAAINSFNAAQSSGSSATTAPASSAPVTTAPAATTAPTASGVVATLWCGNVTNVSTASNLTVWKTGSTFTTAIPGIKVGFAAMENPNTPAATVVATSASLCEEVLGAREGPPPTDLAQFNMAMAYFAQGTQTVHDGAVQNTYAASLLTGRQELSEGMTQLNAFLNAIGG